MVLEALVECADGVKCKNSDKEHRHNQFVERPLAYIMYIVYMAAV